MESKVTTKGNFERLVEVDVPEQELTPHFDNAYEKYRKNIKMEGFRKGKVPLGLIKKMYGDAIKSEAIDEVVQSVFREVKEKEKLRPVAPAKLEDVKYDPEDGLHFKALVEVVPDIELKNYRNLSVEKEVYEVAEEDIADALADVQEQMAVMEPVESEAKADQFILADLQQIDTSGVPIIGRKFEDRLLQLSAEDNELTDQLIGVKTGDTRRVEITVPTENSDEVKKDIFEVRVKEVKEKQIPELDDELAKDAGDFENLEALKDDLRAKITKQTQINSKRQLRQRLIDELLKKNSFDLPETMIHNYLDALVENAKSRAREEIDTEELKRNYRPSAIWTLKWGLVKDKLQELENIEVTKEDEDNFISRIAEDRNVDKKEVRKSFKNVSKGHFRDDVLEEKILDFLEKSAKITEKKITRKDLQKAKELSLVR